MLRSGLIHTFVVNWVSSVGGPRFLMCRLGQYLYPFVFFLALIPSCIASELRPAPRPFPIAFEANRGQASAEYPYLFHRDGLLAMFQDNGVDFALTGPDYRDKPIHLTFLGGHAGPDALEPLAGHSNYFLGRNSSQWIRNVPLYSRIEYNALYRGISLDFYGNGRELEHDFRVDPGADPSQIAFRLSGALRMRLSPAGEIEIASAHGVLTLRRPVAYQILNGGRRDVNAKFLLSSDNTVRFAFGTYDARQPLVIDPVYVFSTYLGGSTGADEAAAVTTDASGNILVTGTTTSTDFPTANALQPSLGSNNQSVFVSKFDPTGKTLIYSTYLGGSSQAPGAPTASGGAIAVDTTGDAIIAGLASSSNFPQAGAIESPSCQINNGCYFLASLKPDGSALNYAGLIGGEQGNYTFGLGGDLTVDASGNAYLAGTTDNTSFQITAGTLATSVVGYPYNEAFVLKVDATGKLLYSTVIPGNDTNSSDLLQPYTNNFIPSGIAVDASGDVTIAGTSGLGLPTTSGVVAPQFPNAYVNVENPSAGFVLQLNPTASAVNFASYVPGTDETRALTVDSNGSLWIAGETSETTLPVSANAYQKAPSKSTLGEVSSGYILEMSPGAASVLTATYLDGTGIGQTYESSSFTSVALDSQSNVFVGGTTSSPDFPLQDPFVTELEYAGTIWDAIVAEMSADLSTVEFGSFLNSTDVSYGGSGFSALTVDSSNNLIVAGTTYSRDFPTTSGSFEPQLPPPASQGVGYLHTFVAKLNMSTPAPSVCFSSFSVSFGNVNANSSGSQTVDVTNCGNASLDISSIASSDPTVTASGNCAAVAPGSVCPITLTFTPVSSKATSGTITLTDNALTIPQTVSFTGQGIAPKIVAHANPLSFGHVLVGAPAIDGTLLISNGGQAALSVGTVTVSGAGYSLVNNGCAQTLPANPYLVCSIEIAFAPANAGTQTGSVIIASNDPATPQLIVGLTGVGDAVYAIPSISSISAPTVLINSGAVNLSISGTNFYPQSIAELNGIALTTTFQSNGSLQATIPALSLTAIGEQYLTITNPLPGGGASPSVTVTPYQTLVINPSALVSVPATGMLYAAIPASATNNPNTVIPINPASGAEGTPISVGNNPLFLAASSDGAYLYVANAVDETVQRINLATNVVERTFPYTPDIYCPSCSTLSATDLETVPGNPQEVLLAQGSILSLFNDAGLVNYVPSTGACCYADPDFGSIALAGNPVTVYGLPFSHGGGFFQVADLTSSGLQYTRPSGYNGGSDNTTGGQVISDGTLLYTSAGQVWNPATQTEVGTFPLQTVNETSYPNDWNITLDTTRGEIYGVGDQLTANSDYVVVSAFGINSYALTGSLAFPQIYSPTENHLVRWGTNGLAFIGPGVGLTDAEVYILRSSIVSPQSANPTPTLASISPTSVNAGWPTFTLTVNGTGFLSSSVVQWNGTPLSTGYVSAQQLAASVPAADIASAGSAQIAVVNPAPGGGSSAASDLTIVSPVPTTTSLSIAPSGGTLTTSASFTVTATVSATSGTSIPTGNVVFTIGSASQTAVLGSSGTATYTGTAPSVTGTLSISAAYQGAPGFQASTSITLNETVIAPSNPVPAVSSLSPAFITAGASNFTLTVSGSGFVSSSTVNWGTTALATQFVSATQLTAQVTASEIAGAGITGITVQTPAPGGGASDSMQFEVDSASSGSGPSFTTLTATVTPGSTATYPVTLPSSDTNVSATCLNLPSGATCTYSAAASAVTIATTATTSAGTYEITVVFTETLPGAATALVFLPIALLPLLFFRRRWAVEHIGFMVFVALALVLAAANGCGGSSSGTGQTQSQTHQATSSGVVTLNVQ